MKDEPLYSSLPWLTKYKTAKSLHDFVKYSLDRKRNSFLKSFMCHFAGKKEKPLLKSQSTVEIKPPPSPTLRLPAPVSSADLREEDEDKELSDSLGGRSTVIRRSFGLRGSKKGKEKRKSSIFWQKISNGRVLGFSMWQFSREHVDVTTWKQSQGREGVVRGSKYSVSFRQGCCLVKWVPWWCDKVTLLFLIG